MKIILLSVILFLIFCLFFATILKFFIIIGFSIIGAGLAIYVNRDKLRVDSRRVTRTSSFISFIRPESGSETDNETLNDDEKEDNSFKSRLLVSKNVDAVLEEISDFVIRDFFFHWYKPLIRSEDYGIDVKIKNEFWGMLSRLLLRMQYFDDVSFITKDIVTAIQKHFQKIRESLQLQKEFKLHEFLETKETETEFLRKVSSIFLVCVLPQEYSKSEPLFHILREIIAVQILYNAIDYVSEPDYINEKLLNYLKSHSMEIEKVRKKYAYAETFEDFIEMINKCNSVDELKRIRYYIITEIMQSSALHNLKRDRNPDAEKEFSQSSTKGSLLMNRDLKKYINQLRLAKRLCSRRINTILNVTSSAREDREELPQPRGKKVLGFPVIIHTDICRNFFKRFLQDAIMSGSSTKIRSAKHLVSFWESVEEMKNQERVKQYQIANELLNHSYFLSSINNNIKLPKHVIQGLHLFVKGDRGPEMFYKIQSVVFDILEKSYYPLFIVSKEYDQMIVEYNDYEQGRHSVNPTETAPSLGDAEDADNFLIGETSAIEEHIKDASERLKVIEKKLSDKNNALEGARSVSEHSGMNMNAKLIANLEKNIKDAEEEMHEVSEFIRWSQQWLRFLMQWKAELHDIQFEMDRKEMMPYAMVIIHPMQMMLDVGTSGGWIIARSINEFIALKHKLKRLKPELKKIEILRLKNVSPNNTVLINKAKESLQQMLDMIFTDDNCLKSEDMFLFCCPSSEDLRQPISARKKSQVSKGNLPFAQFFGFTKVPPVVAPVKTISESNEDDIPDHLFNLDELENRDNGDNIAEPLYNLAGEIFELSGTVGLLRKSLIIIVQITFGQNINKQLRETVSWFSSELMIYYYLVLLRDAFWPNGVLSRDWPEKSKEEKARTAKEARQRLINQTPEIFDKLFGGQRARNGLLKAFEYFQNKQLNKQLIYDLLEAFMFEFVPEMRSKSEQAFGVDKAKKERSTFYVG